MRGIPFSSAWIWGGLFVLVLAVTVRLARAWLRQRAPRAVVRPQQPPMVCPSCRRSFAAGTQFCPADATKLVAAQEGGQSYAEGRGGKCPRCRRAFEGGVRFCPMDAEELVPIGVWQATHAEGGVHMEAFADHLVGGTGKICPVCASKYDLEAGYCGRDASELVTIN
jgi:predicted amidophosphoribosyltransferase